MIVKNPTDNDISVQINGHQYTVKAKDQIANVSATDAAYWKVKIHTFIEIEEEVAQVAKPASKPEAVKVDVAPAVVKAPEALPVAPVGKSDDKATASSANAADVKKD